MLDRESLISIYQDSCRIDSKYVPISHHEVRVSWFSIQGKKIKNKSKSRAHFSRLLWAMWCKQTIGDFQVLSKHQPRIIVHVSDDLVIKVKLLNPVNKELLKWIFKWVLEVVNRCSHSTKFTCIRFRGFEIVYGHVSQYHRR